MAAEVEVDKLTITIEANDNGAETKISNLAKSIQGLVSSATGAQAIGTVATHIEAIKNATAGLGGKGNGASVIQSVADALTSLSKVGDVNIPDKLFEKIQVLVDSTSKISGADVSGLDSVISGVNKISQLKGITIPASIATDVSNLAKAINEVGKVATTKFTGLANSLETLQNVSGTMGVLGNIYEQVMNMSKNLATAGESLKAFGDGVKALNQIKKASIPDGLGEQIRKLAESIDSVTAQRVNNFKVFVEAVQGLNAIKEVRVSNALSNQLERLIGVVTQIDIRIKDRLVELAEGLSKFSAIGDISLTKFINSFQKLPEIIPKFNAIDVYFFTTKIQELSEALLPLAARMKSIGEYARDFTSALSTLQRVPNMGDIGAGAGTGAKGETEKPQLKIDLSMIIAQLQAVGSGITQYMNMPLIQGQSLWTQIGSIASTSMSALIGSLSEVGSKLSESFTSSDLGAKISEMVEEAGEQFEKLKEKFTKAFEEISKNDKVKNITKTVLQPIALAAGVVKTAFESLGKGIEFAGEATKEGLSIMELIGPALKQLGAKIKEFVMEIPVIGPILVLLTEVVVALVQAAGGLGAILEKVTEDAKQFSEITKTVVVFALKKLKSALSALGSKAWDGIVSGIKSVGEGLHSLFIEPFEKAASTIKSLAKRIVNFMVFRQIRKAMTAIAEAFKLGINNLYQYSLLVGTEFAPAMDKLATSALYLKNSFGAMAAPLIQAVAPAVDMLVDKFVELLNIIGKVFAVLTGKTVYTQAKKHAVEYADAANEAAAATQDFMLGIDELNVISESAGSASGAAEDYGSMFEEVEIDMDQFDWAKQIREAVENGDWYKVGEIVGNKLNEVVDGWDSYGWGQKLGGLINNGLNVAYGFLSSFDFKKFGSKVADALNGLFDEVDWDLLGHTVGKYFNDLFDLAYGFASTLKWKDIGYDIATAINGLIDELDPSKAADAVNAFVIGIFDMANTAISNIHWAELGSKLSEFINQVKWYDIVYGALSLITNGLKAAKDLIDGFIANWDWKSMAKQLSSAINDAWNDLDPVGMAQTISNLFVKVLSFAREFISGIEWKQIGIDIGNFLINIDWIGILGGLAQLIVDAIGSAITAVRGLVDTLQPKIKEIATGLADKIDEVLRGIDAEEWGETLHDAIELAIEFLIDFMDRMEENGTFQMIGEKIGDFLEGLDWGGILADWGTVVGQAISARLEMIDVSGLMEVGWNIAAGIFQGFLNKVNEIGVLGFMKMYVVNPMIDNLKSLLGIASPSKVMAEIGMYIALGLLQGITDFFGGILEFLSGGISSIIGLFTDGWQSVYDDTDEQFENIGKNIAGKISTINSDTESGLSEVEGTFKNKFDLIKQNTSTTVSEIQADTKTKYDTMGSDTKNTLDALANDSSVAWSNVKDDTSSKTDLIKNTANTNYSELKNNIANTLDNVKTDSATKWGEIETTTSGKMGDIKRAVDSGMGEVKTSVNTALDQTKTEAGQKDFTSVGSNIISGIASGIRNGIQTIRSAISSVGDAAVSWAKSVFNIHSPSKLFQDEIGLYIGLGIAEGIDDSTSEILSTLSDLSDEMQNELEPLTFSIGTEIDENALKFPEHESAYMSYGVKYHAERDEQDRNSANEKDNSDYIADGVRDANQELIGVLYNVANQIVSAVNDIEMNPVVSLSGDKVTNLVEKTQRQRGASIMKGGVMG